MYNILICDDEKDIVSALKIYLAAAEYKTFEAYNGKEAVQLMQQQEIHLVLMERFVRGDSSRHTEGSGLGLAIARSLVELMNGHFEIAIDGDLFKARVELALLPTSIKQ